MYEQNLLPTVLEQRFSKFAAERKRCKTEFSEEAVHDLRIASRRFLVMVDLLRAVLPNLHLKKIQETIKEQLDSLDELRDTQIMLAEFSDNIDTLPQLAPLIVFLKKKEKRLLGIAGRDVRELKIGFIATQINNLIEKLAEPAAGDDLSSRLLAVVDEASEKVRLRKERVDPSQPFTIHRVRIAFKKFRYLLEIINPIIPGYPESLFKAMHSYQASMGEIQDLEVILENVEEFGSRHAQFDLEPVRQFYRKRHTESINAYIEDMQEFVIFWRETPGNPFPWEIIEKDSQ